MNITIAIKNQSTVVTDAQLRAVVAALQIQLTRDWYPAWHTTATLVALTKNQAIPAGAWPIYILDNTDYAGALGYHDETTKVPYGRVFAKTAMQYGYSWTVTLSHELLEMMADPNVNITVFPQYTNYTGLIYPVEVGDPVEADSYGYLINSTRVSDFVYPAWFDWYQTAPGTKYDHMNHVSAPFQIGTGGYMSVFQVTNGSGWVTINAEKVVVPDQPDTGRNRRVRKS